MPSYEQSDFQDICMSTDKSCYLCTPGIVFNYSESGCIFLCPGPLFDVCEIYIFYIYTSACSLGHIYMGQNKGHLSVGRSVMFSQSVYDIDTLRQAS